MRNKMDLENLLEQTKEILAEHGLAMVDVEWFGTTDYEYICNLQDLLNVDYDDSFGSPEVDIEFILVGNDFWLERHEYDGSEWWEFKRLPKRPSKFWPAKKIVTHL